jgi:hypothetical protein
VPLTDREKALFALAREYIASGCLPRTVPASVGAGPGTDVACSLCKQTTEPRQVEYEFTGDDGVMYRFHMRCHAIWQLAASHSTRGD